MPKTSDLLGIVGSTFTIGSRSLTAGLRRIAVRSGAFLGAIDWTITANRTIVLPDESGTVLLKEPTVGSATFGYSSAKLVSINEPNGSKSFNYNTNGSIASITQTVGAITRVRSFSYGPGGVLISISTL